MTLASFISALITLITVVVSYYVGHADGTRETEQRWLNALAHVRTIYLGGA